MKLERLFLCILLLNLFSGCHRNDGWKISNFGASLKYDGETFDDAHMELHSKLTEDENGTDMPFDVAPANIAISLREKPPLLASADSGLAQIILLPLSDPFEKDYAEAYPGLAGAAEALKKALIRKPMNFSASGESGRDIPEWIHWEASPMIYAKVRYFHTSWFSGIAFVTTYDQELNPVANDGLYFVVQGISRDGRYYIDGHFPIMHPSLPANSAVAESALGDSGDSDGSQRNIRVGKILRETERKLNGFSDESFQPSLVVLTRVFSSLGVSNEAQAFLGSSSRPSVHVPRSEYADAGRFTGPNLDFTIRQDSCVEHWTLHKSPPGLENHSACNNWTLEQQVPLLSRLFQTVWHYDAEFMDTGTGSAPYPWVWEKIDETAPEISERLALAAARSPDWDKNNGVPLSGDVGAFVKQQLEENGSYYEVKGAFRKAATETGYEYLLNSDLEISSVESVLVSSVGELSDSEDLKDAGLKSTDKIPYGGNLFFSLKKKD